MRFYRAYRTLFIIGIILHYLIIDSQQIFQSSTVLSDFAMLYSPVRLSTKSIDIDHVDGWKLCAMKFNIHVLCHVFDFAAYEPRQCHLFQSDTDKSGSIVQSTSTRSIVGTVRISPDLFRVHARSCSANYVEARYLQCSSNSILNSLPNTYWNPMKQMCLAQSPILGDMCVSALEVLSRRS
jgi:hypothetical protein